MWQQRNASEFDVIATILGDTLWEVDLRHEHAARIEVSDVKNDEVAAVVILGEVVDAGRAREPMHGEESDREVIEYGLQHASDGALLGHDHDAMWLLVP